MKKYPSIILSVIMGAAFGLALTYTLNAFAASGLSDTGLVSHLGGIFNNSLPDSLKVIITGTGKVGIGTANPGAQLQVGSHIFIDEPLISANFTFTCSNQAQWTNKTNCGWRYTDSVNHYFSTGVLGRPEICGGPFTQPASGPSVAQMQTIIDGLSPAVTRGLVSGKNFVSSVSGINSWSGINYCGGGGTDGNTGTVTVNFYQPYIDIR